LVLLELIIMNLKEGEVYDYYIDFTKKQLVHWKELIVEWKYDKS